MAQRAPDFFDVDERLAALSAKGNDLERVKVSLISRCSAPRWRRVCRGRIGPVAAGRPSITC
jgi:hypothetical protein